MLTHLGEAVGAALGEGPGGGANGRVTDDAGGKSDGARGGGKLSQKRNAKDGDKRGTAQDGKRRKVDHEEAKLDEEGEVEVEVEEGLEQEGGSLEHLPAIGRRLRVWWPEERAFYSGLVQSYSAELGHEVLYDVRPLPSPSTRQRRL